MADTIQYKSRKDGLFTTIFILIGALLFGIAVFNFQQNITSYIATIIILLTLSFLAWIFFGTKYEISSEYLNYKSGPIFGKIKIANIKEIEKEKTLWVGLKPATAQKGLIIKYNKFDEIYITPLTNDSFIEELLKLNPTIQIN
jgi:PH (Pleckstrin Homology) domain-containing protein